MCEDELTLRSADLEDSAVIGAFAGARLVGVAQVGLEGPDCFLEKLFVDPDAMGSGYGRRLFAWAADAARNLDADELLIDADPDAVLFYLRMGCRSAGSATSGSIPGRTLPRLVYALD